MRGQQYGRWEARVRSRNTGTSNNRTFGPHLIIWPDSDRWPADGGYDFLENGSPGGSCVNAFIHYPHSENVPVQQQQAEMCGFRLSDWHNIAIEWTPDHIRGYVDGTLWYSFRGGRIAGVRSNIQDMPSGH